MDRPATPATAPPPEAGRSPHLKRPAQPRQRVSEARRGRGKELLQELLNLESNYGEFSRQLTPAIDALRHECERTRDSDRDLVLFAIEEGCYTQAEIMRRTGLSSWDVRKILEELEDADIVEVSRQRRPGCDNQVGVPVLLYQFTHRSVWVSCRSPEVQP